jgi:O-antigen ligase
MSKRAIAATVFVASAFVDAPSYIGTGTISLMGVLTVLFAAILGCFVLVEPRASLSGLRRLWPLSLLFAFSCGQFLSQQFSVQAAQTLCLQWIFLALIVLVSNGETEGVDEASVGRFLEHATLFASLCFLAIFIAQGFGSQGLGAISFIQARSYALFALLGVALFAARWALGSRASLWTVAALILLVALSLSRTALVTAILVLPLSQLRPLSRHTLKRLLLLGILAVATLCSLVFSIDALRQRFVGDNTLQDYVSGEAVVDTSGRLAAWGVTLASYVESPWIGKGPGSANDLITDVLSRLEIGHPLNEYLRFLHDEGLIGLVLFLVGSGQLLRLCWRAYRQSLMRESPDAAFHLATFLALFAALVTMLTDNTASYIFVMGPLGIMIGVTLRSLSFEMVPSDIAINPDALAEPGMAKS